MRLLLTILLAATLPACVGTMDCLAPPAKVAAQSSPGIKGTWEFTGDHAGRQRGLLIFTETHYSMMFVRGTSPRATYPESRTITDEEAIAAYRSITANSGTYTLKGDQLTVKAYMANDPNYMGSWPSNDETFFVHVNGNTMTWAKPGLIGLQDDVTLRRVQ